MAAVSAIVAYAALAVAAVSAVSSYQQGKKQSSNLRRSADEQRKIQEEQRASQKAQQMQEQRQQIREERVRRARILQSAENTGTAGSSGEGGALSGLVTQLHSNVGSNLGQIATGNRVSQYSQNAANFATAAQQNGINQSNANSMLNLSMSIFGASGGLGGGGGFQPNASGTGNNPRANDFSQNMQMYGV